MTQLTEMAKPFPKDFLGKDDRGNDAVDHTVVTQRILQILGPYDLEVKEVLRSDVPAMTVNRNKPNERVLAGGHYVTGAVVRLTVTIDGKQVSIDEVGGCENAAMKDGDGERMKHAISDAIKRCAMRLGLGLHMWAQDHYFLHDVLTRDSSPKAKSSKEEPKAAPVKGSKSETTAATSSPSTPEEVEAVASGEVKQTHEESGAAEASSGDIYGVIANAMADRNLHMKVLIGAGKVALEKNATPPEGIHKDNILELPEEVLEVVATNLKLRQGELV